jgi:hypothetical protein
VIIECYRFNTNLLGFGELTKKCIPGFDFKKQPVVYVIDDRLINDASDVVFESSYIRNIEILDNSKDAHNIGSLSNLIVLKIYTQSAPVYIKGTSSKASIDR